MFPTLKVLLLDNAKVTFSLPVVEFEALVVLETVVANNVAVEILLLELLYNLKLVISLVVYVPAIWATNVFNVALLFPIANTKDCNIFLALAWAIFPAEGWEPLLDIVAEGNAFTVKFIVASVVPEPLDTTIG